MLNKRTIKDLEYCAKQGITSECERCKVKPGCRETLIKRALDIIKGLEMNNRDLEELVVSDNREISNLEAEIERLQKKVNLLMKYSMFAKYPHCVLCDNGVILTKSFEQYNNLVADISSKAIKNFAEKFEKKFYCLGGIYHVHAEIFDDLVKEVRGD